MAFTVTATALAVAFASSPAREPAMTNRTTMETVHSPCFDMNIPSNAELSIAATSRGKWPSQYVYRLGDNEGGTVTLWDTRRQPNPKILVLSSYKPVKWDFANFPTDSLLGVIVYSFDQAELVNLPPRVPARFVHFYRNSQNGVRVAEVREESNPAGCGTPHYTYSGGPGLDALVDDAEKATGLKASRFSGGSEVASWLNLQFGPFYPPASKRFDQLARYAGPLPGQDKIDALIAQGFLRPATFDDVEEWERSVTRRMKSGHLAGFRSISLFPRRTLVVLKPFPVPDNMTGAALRQFIVPAGVKPMPDTRWHNSYYFIETGTCQCNDSGM